MRWRNLLQLVGGGGIVLFFVVIYMGLKAQLNFLEWIGLLSIIGAVVRGSMSILDNYYSMFPKMHKIEIEHTDNLIKDVFENQIIIYDVVYDKDVILFSRKEEDKSGQIITCQVDFDKDKVYQLAVAWNEANPLLECAIQHLNHKKYRRTWQAYLYGKEYAERLINKIVENIEQYSDMVIKRVSDAKLPLTLRKDETLSKTGEYSQKRINHIIFYDVLNSFETGYTNKKLELFPVDLKQTSNESVFYLAWCDDNPKINGTVAGDEIARGDKTSLERLRHVIELMEMDKEIINVVLGIDSFKLALVNNSEVRLFEAGRKDILNQVKFRKEVLAGTCNLCP